MKLARNLGLFDVFCICSGAMLFGLFLLPGLAYAKAGPSILLSYLIGGLLAMTGHLSQAELASAMPRAGGTYFQVTWSMGSGVGTVYGLITWHALRLGVDRDCLLHRFLEREKDSSTILSPFLAIPHIILEGEGRFDILLARSRQGIVFSEDAPAVHTVFLLLGTQDERHFHLRSLAAIAQVAQDPHFEEKWMRAKGEEALRDVVPMVRGRRHP